MNKNKSIFISRIVDYSVIFFLGIIISLFSSTYIDPFIYGVFALSVPLIWIPLEALCLTIVGMTLGNFLLGVKVKEKLSYFSALRCALGWKGEHLFEFRKKSRFLLSLCVAIATVGFSLSAPHIKERFTDESERMVETISGWVRYVPPQGVFCAAFPSEPLYELKELNLSIARKLMTYHEYRSYLPENLSYAVSFVQLPSKWRLYSGHTILKAALNLIPENGPLAKVTHQEPTYYKKYPALNFHLKQGEVEIQGRLILVAGTLYKLTAQHPLDSIADLHVEEFLNSFQVNLHPK
jgi:hypothetical protein